MGKLCKCTSTFSLNALSATAPKINEHVRQKAWLTAPVRGLCIVTSSSSHLLVNGLCISQMRPSTRAMADTLATFSEMCLAQSYGVEMLRFINITTSSCTDLYVTSIFSILPSSDRCLRFSSSNSWFLRFLASILDSVPAHLDGRRCCADSFTPLTQSLLHLQYNLFDQCKRSKLNNLNAVIYLRNFYKYG